MIAKVFLGLLVYALASACVESRVNREAKPVQELGGRGDQNSDAGLSNELLPKSSGDIDTHREPQQSVARDAGPSRPHDENIIPRKNSIENEVSDDGHAKLNSRPRTGGIYKVASGDALSMIAKCHHVSENEIRILNKLPAHRSLFVGESLRLPFHARLDVTLKGCKCPGENPKKGDKVVFVHPGDMLSTIAAKKNTTSDALRKENNLKTDTIAVCQKLIIPTSIAAQVKQSTPHLESHLPQAAPIPCKTIIHKLSKEAERSVLLCGYSKGSNAAKLFAKFSEAAKKQGVDVDFRNITVFLISKETWIPFHSEEIGVGDLLAGMTPRKKIEGRLKKWLTGVCPNPLPANTPQNADVVCAVE